MTVLNTSRRGLFGLGAAGIAALAVSGPVRAAKVATKAKIVIIGAGAAGTALVNRLVARLDGAEITKLKASAQAWWETVEGWMRWPLLQMDAETCHLAVLDLLAWQRDITRFRGESEALYRLRPGTPVEIVVREDGWLRVRDPEGGLAWVEGSALSARRMVIVTAERALVRRAPAESAAPAFEATRHVVLELLEPASQGWARVRHVEGFEGFVRASEVWGL